jgi:hypothetical protein
MVALWLERYTFSLGEIWKPAGNSAYFPFNAVICDGICSRLQHGKDLAIRKKKKVTRSNPLLWLKRTNLHPKELFFYQKKNERSLKRKKRKGMEVV